MTFSIFANVSQETKWEANGNFSPSDPGATWTPWRWSKRLNNTEKVEKQRAAFHGNMEDKGSRTKVTTYIASLKSRQEFVPPIVK